MRSLLCLLLLGVFTANLSKCSGECSLNDAIAMLNLMQSMAATVREQSKIVCTDVNQPGLFAACSSDYTVMSCSCGYGCGSWDIQNENKCHCQCANVDWTTARCCKIGPK